MPIPDGPFLAIDAGEARALLDSGEIVIVDVREPHEFAAARIPGALNLPLSRLDPAGLPDDGRRIVLSCAAGARSFKALEMLASAGLDIDTHLRGGLKAWAEAGFPLER